MDGRNKNWTMKRLRRGPVGICGSETLQPTNRFKMADRRIKVQEAQLSLDTIPTWNFISAEKGTHVRVSHFNSFLRWLETQDLNKTLRKKPT